MTRVPVSGQAGWRRRHAMSDGSAGGDAATATREKRMAAATCVAFVSCCLAYTLALPPYEGFDEDGHYSYIAVLADRGQVPDFRSTPLDQAVSNSVDHLPRRYSAV